MSVSEKVRKEIPSHQSFGCRHWYFGRQNLASLRRQGSSRLPRFSNQRQGYFISFWYFLSKVSTVSSIRKEWDCLGSSKARAWGCGQGNWLVVNVDPLIAFPTNLSQPSSLHLRCFRVPSKISCRNFWRPVQVTNGLGTQALSFLEKTKSYFQGSHVVVA